jgi:hypothetical protein
MKKFVLIILGLFFVSHGTILAAQGDSVAQIQKPVFKNVIKFNPTPMVLWSAKNLTFSYERIINPRQSASIEAGYLEMPRLFEDTLVDLVNVTSRYNRGINLTAEYRFYLTKLNTRPVPAGLYIGPYFTYYGYQFKNNIEVLNGNLGDNGLLQGSYWAYNLGLELGYQFVFWKRLTLDLVLVGPSLSYYGGKTTITGEVDATQIEEINQALYDKLKERFPVVQLINVDKTYQQTGKLDVLRLGFRYLMQIGFTF